MFDYSLLDLDEYRIHNHFKGPWEFLTNTIPKIILGKKYRLFSNYTIPDDEKNLIQINIDTGVYDPVDDGGPWYIMQQDIDNPANTPKYWIKMECSHKLKPKLKAKAYFLFNLSNILDTTDLFIRLPYRYGYYNEGNCTYFEKYGYPYPITKYLELEGIEINTPPYNDDDIVIDCNNLINSYYAKFNHYKEERDKLIKLRENTGDNNDKLFMHAVDHEKRRKWYVDETNALVDKIYSVSGFLCETLLGVPVDKTVEGIKLEEKHNYKKRSKHELSRSRNKL